MHVHVAGNDVPGTLVTLQLRRDGQLIPPVTLRRASTLDLADRKRMFALFTEAKGLALKENAGACRRLCLRGKGERKKRCWLQVSTVIGHFRCGLKTEG